MIPRRSMKRRMANGEWRTAARRWLRAPAVRLLAPRSWLPAPGSWLVASALWLIAPVTVTAAAAEPTNSAPVADFSAFRLVAERNIFNPNRSGSQPPRERESRRASRSDTFGLVGTMIYGKGPIAFFDGSSGDYRKALSPGATIAGYTVTEIGAAAVKLSMNGTNTLELRVGSRLRREEGGAWEPTDTAEAFTTASTVSGSPSGTSSSAAGPGGGESAGPISDVLMRLKQKREQEMK